MLEIKNETIGMLEFNIGRNKFVKLPKNSETAEVSQDEFDKIDKRIIEREWISYTKISS
jgi:hypothetical protein